MSLITLTTNKVRTTPKTNSLGLSGLLGLQFILFLGVIMFSTSSLGKIIALSLMSSTLLVVGCAKPVAPSNVVVSPIGGSAYGGSGAYTGGALVDNAPTIQAAAQNLQAVVHFDYDSDVITAAAANILDQHVAFLSQNAQARVQVAGHTDERGSREYNMSLGERRAASVRSYLASKGINAANVEIISFGEEQPVATGSNEAAWSQNRRAELTY